MEHDLEQYIFKHICVPIEHALQALSEDEAVLLDKLLHKIEQKYPEDMYIGISIKDSCFPAVWEIIKEMDEKKIVAFIGREGSGKDYQCGLLKQKGFIQLAFADALRDIAFSALNLPKDWAKENYEALKTDSSFITMQHEGFHSSFNFRKFLEFLGTQGIRKYDPDFWCHALVNTIKANNLHKICVSDMRFINEYETLKEFSKKHGYKFNVIFCDYHSERYKADNNHESARLGNYFAEQGYLDLSPITEEDFAEYSRYCQTNSYT